MSRESAVTETVSYQIENCHLCGSEVGLGVDIPEDEMAKSGYAVLIGEGDVSIRGEKAGNWSAEIELSGSDSDSNAPNVAGHILCVDCAEAVHDHSPSNNNYRSQLPDKLVSGTSEIDIPLTNEQLAVVVTVFVLLLIILAL
ncbi:hypothetical protein [Halosimplex pelagicum]|uniref:Uncharacterized protein n=1 Tax=Halosimplex pelagicum TaxID=869886 RepID=A0A7D5PAK1_9EURY|nr:hypothetical protein [Halosimplex pelagicum]QLH84826.1 hypothetical protein HZS54_25775 [Halosimplex pelagicum]